MPSARLGRVLVSRRLCRGDVMRAREDCQDLLASINKTPLSVNEIAVAFENCAAPSIYFLWLSTTPDATVRFARTRPGCSRLLFKGKRFSPLVGSFS